MLHRCRTKKKRKDAKKGQRRKLEKIRKESHLPVGAKEREGDLLSGADDRDVNNEMQPPSKK